MVYVFTLLFALVSMFISMVIAFVFAVFGLCIVVGLLFGIGYVVRDLYRVLNKMFRLTKSMWIAGAVVAIASVLLGIVWGFSRG